MESPLASSKPSSDLWEAFPPSRVALIKKTLQGTTINTPNQFGKVLEALFDDSLHVQLKHLVARRAPETLRKLFRPDSKEGHEFYSTLLPFIVNTALQLEQCFPDGKLPCLPSQQNAHVIFTRTQIACLIANGFLGTFPAHSQRHNDLNFHELWVNCSRPQSHHELAKVLMILNYFRRCLKDGMPAGHVVFQRKVENTFPDYAKSTKPLKAFKVDPTGTIEDAPGTLQADFANQYIGGGVLVGGCVQEEIRFSVNTELLASMAVTEILEDNEALLMVGTERFSSYKGYAFGLKYGGDYAENLKMAQPTEDGVNYLDSYIIGFDAKDYRRGGSISQYQPSGFVREMNKCYAAFHHTSQFETPKRDVATGNWGCGAFLGNKEHKSLLQWLAASESDRDLIYFTFRDRELTTALEHTVAALRKANVTVGQLYQCFDEFSRLRDPDYVSFCKFACKKMC